MYDAGGEIFFHFWSILVKRAWASLKITHRVVFDALFWICLPFCTGRKITEIFSRQIATFVLILNEQSVFTEKSAEKLDFLYEWKGKLR